LALFGYDGGPVFGRIVMPEMSEVADFKVSGRSTDRVVNFKCPWCRVPLSSPLRDAGNPDKCPQCGCDFLAPGREILEKEAALEAEKMAQEERQGAARQAENAGRAKPATAKAHHAILPLVISGMVACLIVAIWFLIHLHPRATAEITATQPDNASAQSRVAAKTITAPQTKRQTQREIELKKVRDDEVKMQMELFQANADRARTELSGQPVKALTEYVTAVTTIKLKYISMQMDGINRIKAAGEGTPEDDEMYRKLKLQGIEVGQAGINELRR
jgi:hypothetical protein